MIRPFAEIVSELVSTGLDQRQLGLLLELVSVMSTGLSSGSPVESLDDATERRRKYDREYKRNRRLKARLMSSTASTGQSTGQVDTSCNLSSSTELVLEERGSREEGLLPVIVEGRKAKVSRGTRLDQNSKISDDDYKFALDAGLSPERIAHAWAEFVDYWIGVPGQRGTKTNWPATWRNRVRAISGKSGARNGFGGPRPLQDDEKSSSRAAGRLADAARRGEFSFGPRPSLLPGPDENAVQLLPKG